METGEELLVEEEANSIEVDSQNMSLDAFGTESNSTHKEKAQSSNSAVSVSGPSKKRKKSIYWEEFEQVDNNGYHSCKLLNPEFVVPSRRTITRDCYALFIEERRKLKSCLSNLSCRVCLPTDTWTSGQNLSYMCLTVHFIDDNWKLNKKILNFCPIAGHSGELIGKAVEKCLIEWEIKKVMTITVDNASSNDLAVKYLRGRLNHWGGSVLDGQYLHMRCAAHILNLIVKEGLKDLDASISKIRAAVRYVRSSPARLQKFVCCVEEEKIDSKGLVCLDVDTRWNSTYFMLACAIKFRKAFANLQSKGGPYVKELLKYDGLVGDQDWDIVGHFLPFLEIFYDATLKFSGSLYVTGNFYAPQIFGIGDVISTYGESEDVGIKKMALQMQAKLLKYWGNINNVNILLFVALALDPRYKLDYVEFVVGCFYDKKKSEMLFSKIQQTFRVLVDAYSAFKPQTKKSVGNPKPLTCPAQLESCETLDVQQRLKMKYRMNKASVDRKTELDKYLGDECEPDESAFEILKWWSANQNRYPIISMIARDVLAIPVSTVASESAFSTGGRVLDSFRTSLTPRMVEALVCGQDWLRVSRTHVSVEESLLELEDMEEGMKSLTLEQPVIEIEDTVSLVAETWLNESGK